MDIERIHDVLFFCHHSFWSTNYDFCFHMLTFIRALQYPSFHSWNVLVPPWFHSSEPSHQHIGFLQLLSSTLHDLWYFTYSSNCCSVSLLIALPTTSFACFSMLLYRVLFFSVAVLKIAFYAAFFHAITPFTYSLHHHMFPRFFLLSTNFIACLQNWFLGFPLILCISIDQLSSFTYMHSRFTHTKLCIGYFWKLTNHEKLTFFIV